MKNSLVVVLFCAAATSGAAAEIRKTVGSDGKVTLSNVPQKVIASPRAVAGEGGDVLRPAVIGAVANVMGVAHLISSSRTFCVATQPTSYRRYTAAADAWRKRNAAVMAHQERIMALGDQRLVAHALNGDMVRQTEDMLRPVRSAAPAEKIAWCERAFADVDRGVLDLAGRASIAPLMSYKTQ